MLFSSVLTNRYTRVGGQEPPPDIFLNKHTDICDNFASLRSISLKTQSVYVLGQMAPFDGKGGIFVRQYYTNQNDDNINTIVETDLTCVYIRFGLLSVAGSNISGMPLIRNISTDFGTVSDGILSLMKPTLPVVTSQISFVGGSQNVIIYTVPSTPTGNGRFILTRCIVRLGVALIGTGTMTISIGLTSGTMGITLPVVITSSTIENIIGGETIASLGTSMSLANAYEATLSAGQNIYCNLTKTGIVTDGRIDIYLYGIFLTL
jgi:hypothetical protein